MCASRQTTQHLAGIGIINGLAQNRVIHDHHGIRPDDESAGVPFGNHFGLAARQSFTVHRGELTLERCFIDVGWHHVVRDANEVEQFATARRLRRKNYTGLVHASNIQSRIHPGPVRRAARRSPA